MKLAEDRGRQGFGGVDDIDDVDLALALCMNMEAIGVRY